MTHEELNLMSADTLEPAEVVEGTATELVATEAPPPTTLFRTDDPDEVIERASKAAGALKAIIEKQGLATRIQGRDHVRVEGWQTLGTMLGVTSVCTWTRKVGDEKTGGWEARVEARTLDGRVIGAAEAECLRSERTWKGRDDFAIRSMAQTRATSKALRSVLAFVVTLAGYAPTPAEEAEDQPPARPEPQRAQVRRPSSGSRNGGTSPASVAQRKLIFARAKEHGVEQDQLKAIFDAVAGTTHSDRIAQDKVDAVLAAIEAAS